MTDIHSCSYYCDRPECIKAQRDELRDRLAQPEPGPWVQYNHLTATYDTPDGTKVPEELADNAQRLLDFWHIASIRETQRSTLATTS